MVTVWVASSQVTLAPRGWATQPKRQHGAAVGYFGGHIRVDGYAVDHHDLAPDGGLPDLDLMLENLPQDRYDTTIKELFANGEEELISFFGHLKTKVVQHLNIEFARVEKKRSELILECRTELGSAAVHLEFQSTNDTGIPFRMLRYATELQQKYKLPVYLVYFGEREMTMDDGLSYNFGPQNHLDYRYRAVDLGSISREEIKQTNNYTLYALLPLANRRQRK